jgi:hypothetical protein
VQRRSPSGRALLRAAELGRIKDVACAMDECLFPEELGGRDYFLPRFGIPSDWSPTANRHPTSHKDGGSLKPENVRLAHRLCSRVASAEANGISDRKDREKAASLKQAAQARPEFGKIVVLFAEQLRLWRLTLPPSKLRPGVSGGLAGHGWHIQYVIREDAAGIYLEYYAENRFVWGASRVRIHADGHIEANLPTLLPFTVIRRGEDPEEAERRSRETNERIMPELQKAGFFQFLATDPRDDVQA